MPPAGQSESFQTLFRHPPVIRFAEKALIKSYVECAPGREAAMRALLEQAFATLAAASQDEAQFKAAVTAVSAEVFHKPEPDFWFNQLYARYKREFKPPDRFEKLHEWLVGESVLDLGCGNGLTSAVLHQHGYRVYLTDVLDYRDDAARPLPFAPMTDPRLIPYPDQRFDTSLVFAVLHHVEAADLLPLLGELRRHSRRVIVEEDSYDVPASLPGLAEAVRRDDLLREFMSLPIEDQRRLLMFVDYFANALTQGLPQMDLPFNFKTVGQWQALFAAQGLRVAHTVLKGFQANYFNRSCHVWFILDA
jgi:SAM-dependent methyltransferase